MYIKNHNIYLYLNEYEKHLNSLVNIRDVPSTLRTSRNIHDPLLPLTFHMTNSSDSWNMWKCLCSSSPCFFPPLFSVLGCQAILVSDRNKSFRRASVGLPLSPTKSFRIRSQRPLSPQPAGLGEIYLEERKKSSYFMALSWWNLAKAVLAGGIKDTQRLCVVCDPPHLRAATTNSLAPPPPDHVTFCGPADPGKVHLQPVSAVIRWSGDQVSRLVHFVRPANWDVLSRLDSRRPYIHFVCLRSCPVAGGKWGRPCMCQPRKPGLCSLHFRYITKDVTFAECYKYFFHFI